MASKTTVDHDEIRRWVEERGGYPARVKWTSSTKKEAGLLRIDFPGFSGDDTLEHIDWETWFETFDESDLAFVCQDAMPGGQISRFNKLVARHRGERHAAPP